MDRTLATVRPTFIPILQTGRAKGLAEGHHGSGPLHVPLFFLGFSLEFMPWAPSSLQDETVLLWF